MTTDQRQTLALRALAIRLIQDRVKASDTANREAIDEAYPIKAREPVWLSPAGGDEQVEVGHVRKDKGTASASVTNMRELLDWCEATHPDEVFEPLPVSQIRPAYLGVLLAAAREQGVPVDPQTGEIVPGITVIVGDPRVVVVPAKTPEAEAALVDLLRTDRLALQSVLALSGTSE